MNTWPEGLAIGPIREWPGAMTPETSRVVAPFSATLDRTLALLDREIRSLADTVVEVRSAELLVAIPPEGFRVRDGRPRSNAQAAHPGVVFSMDTRHGHLSYPADRFTEWQDNLRAIALSLEALRRVDRYGVTAHGEQYRGFLALESGGSTSSTVKDALIVLGEVLGGAIDEDAAPDELVRWIRRAKAKAHPDRGGDSFTWSAVMDAEQRLRSAGRLR